jgi:hypothetical protein
MLINVINDFTISYIVLTFHTALKLEICLYIVYQKDVTKSFLTRSIFSFIRNKAIFLNKLEIPQKNIQHFNH